MAGTKKWPKEKKKQILAEALEFGFAVTAKKYDINLRLIYNWKYKYLSDSFELPLVPENPSHQTLKTALGSQLVVVRSEIDDSVELKVKTSKEGLESELRSIQRQLNELNIHFALCQKMGQRIQDLMNDEDIRTRHITMISTLSKPIESYITMIRKLERQRTELLSEYEKFTVQVKEEQEDNNPFVLRFAELVMQKVEEKASELTVQDVEYLAVS